MNKKWKFIKKKKKCEFKKHVTTFGYKKNYRYQKAKNFFRKKKITNYRTPFGYGLQAKQVSAQTIVNIRWKFQRKKNNN